MSDLNMRNLDKWRIQHQKKYDRLDICIRLLIVFFVGTALFSPLSLVVGIGFFVLAIVDGIIATILDFSIEQDNKDWENGDIK